MQLISIENGCCFDGIKINLTLIINTVEVITALQSLMDVDLF